jgi:decaprenylphospho-beta-D-ribofuranose 2-oxidase
MTTRPTILSGFDGTEFITTRLARPDRYKALESLLKQSDGFIAQGGGLSYCAASVSPNGDTVSIKILDRILAFNEQSGEVVVEAGISLGKLLRFLIPKGWILPILPGHPSITVGGCIGFNVHGKSQHSAGNFEQCVEGLSLYHPDRGHQSVSRTENPELFWLTLGGFGLTGVVISAKLCAIKLNQNCLKLERIPVKNIVEAVATMTQLSESREVIYSWNNLNLSGQGFGRGFVYTEEFVSGNEPWDQDTMTLTPDKSFRLPIPLLNHTTSKIMCRIYGFKEKLMPRQQVLGLIPGSFPISGKEIYFRLFGPKGFREYQCLIPFEMFTDFAWECEKGITAFHLGVSLGSLKIFKSEPRYLNFSGKGICLTLDFPRNSSTDKAVEYLDSLVIQAKGIVNLSKDSRITAETAHKMFTKYEDFWSKVRHWDQNSRCQSELRKRLEPFHGKY